MGEYFVACYPIRVGTLIDFGPFFIRVAALIDSDTLFGLGSLPQSILVTFWIRVATLIDFDYFFA